MNLILLHPEDFVGDSAERVALHDQRRDHVARIHRAKVGDRLRVGAVGGRIGTGTVTALDARRLEMDIVLERDPPAPLPATVILALPRPIMLKRVLHSVASMGVKRIALIGARRVEKSFWNSRYVQPEPIREQLLLGLEQAGDTVIPEIHRIARFKEFVHGELLSRWAAGTRALVAHPGAGNECPAQVGAPVTLAVGPEGGFSDFEIETFAARGFEVVHLGERILRVEAAVPALLARLC